MTDYTQPYYDQWNASDKDIELSGYVNAGTGENNVPVTADITHSWVNPNNLTLESLADARLTSAGGSYVFPYLRASNFDLDIPAGATILGIELDITWYYSNVDYTLAELYLAWGTGASVFSTTNKGTGQTLNRAQGEEEIFGGPTDLWGSSLTPAIVNSTDFGIVFKPAKTVTDSSYVGIDRVGLKVYYSVTEDGEVRVTQSEGLILFTYASDVIVTQTFAEVLLSVTEQGTGATGRKQTIVVT
jgi:hypothetical protein